MKSPLSSVLERAVVALALHTAAVCLPLFAVTLCRADAPRPVMIVPVDGEIEDGLVYVVRRALREAQTDQARALILHMDTPGGKVSAMEKIMQDLAHATVPVYTYVDTKALSAGAMIAAATRAIFMAPQSQIGAAMLIQMPAVPFGGVPRPLDDSVREKMLSAYRAMVRSACERNGHRWELFHAMMDADAAISNLVEKGSLLTLTAQEAVTQQLARAIVSNIPQLLELIGTPDAPVVRVTPTSAEHIARFLTGTLVSGLLLALGLGGLFLEMRTPGFGVPGTIGIVCLVLFFWGHSIAGMSGWLEVALFLTGVILLLIEIFLIPGFGVTGITGIALIVAALILSMLDWTPAQGVPPASLIFKPVAIVAGGFLGSVVLLIIAARLFPHTPGVNRVFLNYSLSSAASTAAGNVPPSVAALLSKSGIAKTVLRPAGKAVIDGTLYDVVTEGEFISAGTPVRVVSCAGNRIVVNPENGFTAAAS